jgi:hypothetical protein
MWTFESNTGRLLHDGRWCCTGYSGHEEGKLNPLLQAVHNVGPIPVGRYRFEGPPFNEAGNPGVLRILPLAGTETFGRSGFLLHGDMVDPAQRGQASLGCVIMPREVREEVWASGDWDLVVLVAGLFPTTAAAAPPKGATS